MKLCDIAWVTVMPYSPQLVNRIHFYNLCVKERGGRNLTRINENAVSSTETYAERRDHVEWIVSLFKARIPFRVLAQSHVFLFKK